MKLGRINMAFAPALHDYIRVMSMVQGKTLTEFVNDVMTQHMELNRDTYEQALKFVEGLRSLNDR